MLVNIWSELSQYSIPEIIAVIASLSYTLLAAREDRACWPAAFIGSLIYIVVFWQYKLYMDSALNIYYAAMAVVGWFSWQASREIGIATTSSPIIPSPIVQWQAKQHIQWTTLVLILSVSSGYYLAKFTDAAFPYLDSFTTWASLLATWMVVKKVLETWLYWFFIDFVSMLLYFNKGLLFTALLFALYLVIVIYAYFNWRNIMQQNLAASKHLNLANG